MSALAALGLGADGARPMLIDPPDGVLAEAARLDPRPTVASSLRTAEPALQIAWWPRRGELTAEAVSRLAWMLSVVEGSVGWLVSDGDDESPSPRELRAALAGSPLRAGDEVALDDGAAALRLTHGAG